MRNVLVILALVMLAGLGYYFFPRSHSTKAETAEQFVLKWAAAHERKDVDAVLAMTAKRRNPARAAAEKSELGREVIELDEAKQREELAKEFKDNSMWIRAASRTRYVGERAHEDHIHVEVRIDSAASAIVLVREDGTLKMAPDPSNYD